MTSGPLVSLANHLWQSTLFVAIVWLATLRLRANAASLRHRLWLASSVKFLVPFSLLVGLGAHVPLRTAAIAAPRQIAVVINPIAKTPQTLQTAAEKPLHLLPVASRYLPAMAGVLWFCGFSGCAGFWFVRWKQLLRILRRGVPLDLHLRVPAIISAERIEPGVFGVFHPVLLLPEGITQRLTSDQLRAMLAHEMCHVRRRDNIVTAVHMLVETLFWFHPVVWWIERRLIEEQERACDEEVLRQGCDPHVYAESILRICEFYLSSPLICVPGITGSDLRMRVQEIMRNSRTRRLSPARRLLLAIGALLVLACPIVTGIGLRAQTPIRPQTGPSDRSRPAFEVASIRRNTSGQMMMMMGPSAGGLFTATNAPLRVLITYAYSLRSFQLSGAPSWINSERFDISAKAEGNRNPKEYRDLLQTLLEERFVLKFHWKAKEGKVYLLVVNNAGRLRQTKSGDCPQAIEPPSLSAMPPANPPCGAILPRPGNVKGHSVTLAQLADSISDLAGQPVLDRTGLTARYDIGLQWTPARPTGAASPDALPVPAADSDGPSLFTALEEQVGVKLQAAKAPVQTFVIDQVERPSQN